jgi:histone deacetylase 11
MTWKYLFKLNYSLYICSCLEVPLFFMPAFLLRIKALEPMQRATQGSVDASCLAFMHGWAINLAGGYHHACKTHGGGFCIYPDITFIVHSARMHHGIRRVMIIDLDAHQGNGHERDFIDDKEVHIVDVYNPDIYPGDQYAERGISTLIPVFPYDTDETYLDKLNENLPSALSKFKPELIIYNAGTDCMKGDPLGRLNISPEGVIKRDETVFRIAFDKKVPIVMVLSGGYQKTNAPTIAESIENLVQKFNLKQDKYML